MVRERIGKNRLNLKKTKQIVSIFCEAAFQQDPISGHNEPGTKNGTS